MTPTEEHKTKALVVVAHPDDHFIWMGGTIFMLKDDWDWYVLYLCDYSDLDKREKSKKSFNNSCKILGVKMYEPNELQGSSRDMKNYPGIEDIQPQQVINMYKELQRFWDENTNQKKENYDIIFTHSLNPHNEYSFHANHTEVREVLYRCLGKMNSYYYRPLIAHFCYNPRGKKEKGTECKIKGGEEIDRGEATHIVSLSEDARNLKSEENFLKIFPWAKKDIEAFGIPKKEGFKILFLDSYLVNNRENFSLPSIFQENK